MYKKICVNVEEADKTYLQENGINVSKFVRQAVKAYKEGKIKYNYLDKVQKVKS